MDYYKKYLKYKKKYLISKKIFIGGNPSSIHIFKKLIRGGTPDSEPEIELSGGNIFCIAAAEMLDKFEFDFQNKKFQLDVLAYLIDLKAIVLKNLYYLQEEVKIGNVNRESLTIFETQIDTIIVELRTGNINFLKEKIGNIANKVSDLDFKLVKTGCWQNPKSDPEPDIELYHESDHRISRGIKRGINDVNTNNDNTSFTFRKAVLFVLARLQFLSGEGLDLSVPFFDTLLGLIVNSDAHKNIRIIKELEIIIFFQPGDPKTDKRIDRYIIQNLYYYLQEDEKCVYYKDLIHSPDNECLGSPYTKTVGLRSPIKRVKKPPKKGGSRPLQKPGLRIDLKNIDDFYDKLDLPETPGHFDVVVENNNTNLDEDVDDDPVDKLERTLSDSITKLDKLENTIEDYSDSFAIPQQRLSDILLLNWYTVQTMKDTIERKLYEIYRDRSTLEEKCIHCIKLTNKDSQIINGAFKRMLINISKYCKVYFQIFNKTNHTREKFIEILETKKPFIYEHIFIENCIDLMIECLENKKDEVALKTQYNVICLLLLNQSPAREEEEEPLRPYQILKKRIHAIQELLNKLLDEHPSKLSIDTHEQEQLHKVADIVKNIITDTTCDSESHEGKKLINDWFKNIRTNYEKFIEEIDEPCIKDAIKDELDSTTSFTGTLIGNDTKRHNWTGVSFNKDFKDRLKKKWGENDTFTKGSKLGISIVSTINCVSVDQTLDAAEL